MMDEAYCVWIADIQIMINITAANTMQIWQEDIGIEITPLYVTDITAEKTSIKAMYSSKGDTIKDGRMPVTDKSYIKVTQDNKNTERIKSIDFHGYEAGKYIYRIDQEVPDSIVTEEHVFYAEIHLGDEGVQRIELLDENGNVILDHEGRRIEICFHDMFQAKQIETKKRYSIEMERLYCKIVEEDDIMDIIDIEPKIITHQLKEHSSDIEVSPRIRQRYEERRVHGQYTQKGIEMIEKIKNRKVYTRMVQAIFIMLFAAFIFKKNTNRNSVNG